jgi:hypothetical protein
MGSHSVAIQQLKSIAPRIFTVQTTYFPFLVVPQNANSNQIKDAVSIARPMLMVSEYQLRILTTDNEVIVWIYHSENYI